MGVKQEEAMKVGEKLLAHYCIDALKNSSAVLSSQDGWILSLLLSRVLAANFQKFWEQSFLALSWLLC